MKKKGKYIATYAISEKDNPHRFFGALGGQIYPTIDDAWFAILNDAKEIELTYGNVKSESVDVKHYKYSIQFEDGTICDYEPQKLSSLNPLD